MRSILILAEKVRIIDMAPSAALPRVLLVVVLLGFIACGNGEPATDAGPRVVATTTILGDVVENIVGADASVEVLLPVGADPHDYQASARQVAALQDADLVVANGLMLEEALTDVLEGAAADGANIYWVGEHLDPLPFGGQDGTLDPHVWLDPARMAEAAMLIAGEMIKVDDTVDWGARADAYARELSTLDSEISDLLAGIPASDRKLVSNHDSLGYFADRYGFDLIGTVIPGGATLADPSSAEMANLVQQIQLSGVKAIFAETTEPSTLAEAIAAEVGAEVRVVALHVGSLGEPGSGADTLIGMLRTNAEQIAAALAS